MIDYTAEQFIFYFFRFISLNYFKCCNDVYNNMIYINFISRPDMTMKKA